jgi:hypothetical protein
MDLKEEEADFETLTFLDEGLSNIIEKKLMYIHDPNNTFPTNPHGT